MNYSLKKAVVLLLVLGLIIVTFTGCIKKAEEPIENDEKQNIGSEAAQLYPMEVEDDFGYNTTIETQPSRIISLAPSHTEILFELGLGENVVGVTTYCDYPEQAKTKEKVGDSATVNVEKIIELNPDLVVQYGSGNEESNKRIRDAGITILSYEPESIDEVIALIKRIGDITNTRMPATMITVDMMSKKDYIVNRVNEAEKEKVFYEVWNEPLMAAGPGSFLDELITLGGGDNIAKDAQGAYAQFDLEQMIERNPDVYITAKDSEDKTVESIKSRQGYDVINAIKNDRVYILEPNIISRPGPRIVDGLELMAKSIHPELFKK